MTENRLESARELYEERAAIREFCAGYPRNEAERLAKAETVSWLKAHKSNKETQS